MISTTLLLLQNDCDGFAPMRLIKIAPLPPTPLPQESRQGCFVLSKALSASISSIPVSDNDKNPTYGSVDTKYFTNSTSFSLQVATPSTSRRRRAWNFLKRKTLFWRNRSSASRLETCATPLNFEYDYDVIGIPAGVNNPSTAKTTGVMLIHPIGVGIARWYYQRLITSLIARQAKIGERLVVVVPDLLGSGSACNATAGSEVVQKFPLFNISDWTDQLEDLMSSVEIASESSNGIDRWCVVTNGGCSPIALQLAACRNCDTETTKVPVSNLVLSSVPRLPFFLKNETSNDAAKVKKSYRTLSGTVGKLFWWYSCRNNGAFIQTFSEKNLIADPKNLGPTWRSNCYETAISFDGRGKYSTFSFLAGTLQDGCASSLEAIKNTPLAIDLIKGIDVRRNRARSWFWQKPKKTKNKEILQNTEQKVDATSTDTTVTVVSNTSRSNTVANTETNTNKPHETFRDYVEKNGNGGRELVIDGRISLAHEDPEGYADAMLQFLFES